MSEEKLDVDFLKNVAEEAYQDVANELDFSKNFSIDDFGGEEGEFEINLKSEIPSSYLIEPRKRWFSLKKSISVTPGYGKSEEWNLEFSGKRYWGHATCEFGPESNECFGIKNENA